MSLFTCKNSYENEEKMKPNEIKLKNEKKVLLVKGKKEEKLFGRFKNKLEKEEKRARKFELATKSS